MADYAVKNLLEIDAAGTSPGYTARFARAGDVWADVPVGGG